MTKVLVCEMEDEESTLQLKSFIQLAKEVAGWQFLFIENIEKHRKNPSQWLDDIGKKIDNADIFISFNGMFFLNLLGTDLEKYQKKIISKIESGTPIISRFFEPSSVSFEDDCFSPVCAKLGVNALNYRVFSDYNRPNDDPNPYCTVYRKSDGALLDPQLFKQVSDVQVDSAVLLNYSPSYFPMIEVDTNYYKLIDAGDIQFSGSLGMRKTIAVRGDKFSSIQIIYTGRIIEDNFQDLYGRVHFGLEKNTQFAINIIDSINELLMNSSKHLSTCYYSFSQLERKLGILIEANLTKNQIESWLFENESSDRHSKIDLSQVNFSDLVKIVCSHWQVFRQSIELDKEEFKTKCFAINKRERRYLAHPIKAEIDGYTFKESSYRLIHEVLSSINHAD